MDLQKNFKRQVLGVSLAIMGIAFVLSVGSNVLAQTVDSSAGQASAEQASAPVAIAETSTDNAPAADPGGF